ncbi:MAG: winged helix DNA-binding protein [Acidimicrobiaceae bacterium]|nr:winged helix DNA-binding protein [Acidimicrobiaceae bacterium]
MSTGSDGSRSRPPSGPFVGSMTRLVWQWVRREIYIEVIEAGFDDLKPAHVGIFRYPTAEGMRPVEVADEMQITKQSVNELLGHLEQHGYLVREPDPTDSRSKRIRLTRKGRHLENVVWTAAARAEQKAGELLGKKRLQDLRRSLGDLVALLPDQRERIT